MYQYPHPNDCSRNRRANRKSLSLRNSQSNRKERQRRRPQHTARKTIRPETPDRVPATRATSR